MLTRTHLEAVLIATAIVRADLAVWFAERVDTERLSPAAWALLEQLAYDDPTHGADRSRLMFPRKRGEVRTATKAQTELADRVEAVTVAELVFWPIDVLLNLVNQLPERTRPTPSWERYLDAIGDSAA